MKGEVKLLAGWLMVHLRLRLKILLHSLRSCSAIERKKEGGLKNRYRREAAAMAAMLVTIEGRKLMALSQVISWAPMKENAITRPFPARKMLKAGRPVMPGIFGSGSFGL